MRVGDGPGHGRRTVFFEQSACPLGRRDEGAPGCQHQRDALARSGAAHSGHDRTGFQRVPERWAGPVDLRSAARDVPASDLCRECDARTQGVWWSARWRQGKCALARRPSQRIRAKPFDLDDAAGATLSLWCILAVNPPAGSKPVVWRLPSNRPVHTLQEAVQRIGWYRMRREIEVLFLILKEGWRVEALQLGRSYRAH